MSNQFDCEDPNCWCQHALGKKDNSEDFGFLFVILVSMALIWWLS